MQGQPIIIVTRKELLGREHPDFSGPDFLEAKMDALKSEGLLPGHEEVEVEDEDTDPVGKPHGMDMKAMHAELMKIADELESNSTDLSGRIRAICECMQTDTAEAKSGVTDSEGIDFDTPDAVTGEERELT